MEGDEQPDTGGDGEQVQPDTGWDDTDSDGLWGWLSSIFGGLENIWEAITNLPKLIWDNFKQALSDIKDAILYIPEQIIEGIKDIFVPDMNVIETHVEAFCDEILMKFGIHLDFFSVMFEEEMPVTDITIPSYEIPGVGYFVIQVLDTKYFVQGITYFRPFIRGFLVLLIGLYNIKMFLSFIRQDLGISNGKGGDDTPADRLPKNLNENERKSWGGRPRAGG